MSGFFPRAKQIFIAVGLVVVDTRSDSVVFVATNGKDARYIASLKNNAVQ